MAVARLASRVYQEIQHVSLSHFTKLISGQLLVPDLLCPHFIVQTIALARPPACTRWHPIPGKQITRIVNNEKQIFRKMA